MIQRIQTVWLLLAAVIAAVLGTIMWQAIFPQLGQTGYESQGGSRGTPLLFTIGEGLIWLIFLISVFAISLFKHRKRQMTWTKTGIWLSLFYCVWFYTIRTQLGWTMLNKNLFFAAIAIVVLLFLALRFIHKDEEKVRNADRIR
ncbi:MAG: DUF4293 family protein [Prevotellaceae bacterium]|jgi:uncharacterized membrane protein|nr:DUF4293 family protein [Prevotellaceae bacterium]MDY3855485.1 DUF4293 family protein [Bacteroidaceae bacterium]